MIMIKKQKRIAVIVCLLVLLLAAFAVFKIVTKTKAPEMNSELIYVSPDMSFGSVIDSASSDFGGGETFAIDVENAKKEIDSISALDMDFVRFNIKQETLAQANETAKLNEVVSYARDNGLKIYIGYWGREAWLNSSIFSANANGGGGKATWEDFKQGYKEDVALIMENYSPDYIMILPQCPFGIGQQIDSERSLEEWLNFSKEVALEIKRVSFSTKVVLEETMLTEESQDKLQAEFVKMLLENNDSSLDIISLAVNDASELEKSIDNFSEIKNKYHWHGDFWIANGSDVSSRENSIEENYQKDFLLYSIHLADSNGFSGWIAGSCRDGADWKFGIVNEDYSSKASYSAIGQVIKNKDKGSAAKE